MIVPLPLGVAQSSAEVLLHVDICVRADYSDAFSPLLTVVIGIFAGILSFVSWPDELLAS